jgi:organic hydroperoxide reductase OsmC/OhrA
MLISATVKNSLSSHQVEVRTGEAAQTLPVQCKATGRGSSINGGEFLMLALATCYCNDLFREAARLDIPVAAAEVEASAEFPGVGLAATNICYRAKIESSAPPDEVARLLRETDAVAEVHNTLRAGVPVELIHR